MKRELLVGGHRPIERHPVAVVLGIRFGSLVIVLIFPADGKVIFVIEVQVGDEKCPVIIGGDAASAVVSAEVGEDLIPAVIGR